MDAGRPVADGSHVPPETFDGGESRGLRDFLPLGHPLGFLEKRLDKLRPALLGDRHHGELIKANLPVVRKRLARHKQHDLIDVPVQGIEEPFRAEQAIGLPEQIRLLDDTGQDATFRCDVPKPSLLLHEEVLIDQIRNLIVHAVCRLPRPSRRSRSCA